MPSFRLDKEPWIPVVRRDGRAELVTLRRVFSDATAIARIGGSPLEVTGIMRLLQAIVQISCPAGSLDAWHRTWTDRTSALDRAAAYVGDNVEFWDLYSSDKPFLQCSELGDQEGSPLDPDFLDRSKSGRDPHIDHSAYYESLHLPSDQAARAILALNLFCVGGMGTPNPLIPRRGKDLDKFSSDSIAAQSCVCFVEGTSLSETLVLNLIAGAQLGTPGWLQETARTRDRLPSSGLADNYTRPQRTVLLFPSDDGRKCTSAFITSGAPFDSGDSEEDPMIPQAKGTKGYYAFQLDSGVALWRSANVLLANEEKPLRIIDQIGRISRRYDIDLSEVTLRLIGIRGKRGKAKHYFWRDESLSFGQSLLRDQERAADLRRAITNAQDEASRTRNRIDSFAARYLQNGAEAKPDKADVGRLADELSPDLQDYWSMLAPMGERIACDDFDEARWVELLKTASDTAFRRAIDRLPPDARRFRAEYSRTQTKEKATV